MNIVIIGPSRSGKSSVAELIRRTLQDHGMFVDIVDDDGDAELVAERNDYQLSQILKGQTVAIEMIQTRKDVVE